jgi:hypothetical protein
LGARFIPHFGQQAASDIRDPRTKGRLPLTTENGDKGFAILTVFFFTSCEDFSSAKAQLAYESMVTTQFGSRQLRQKNQGRKMVFGHSQTTDDLFALDFFAIFSVFSGLRSEDGNRKVESASGGFKFLCSL